MSVLLCLWPIESTAMSQFHGRHGDGYLPAPATKAMQIPSSQSEHSDSIVLQHRRHLGIMVRTSRGDMQNPYVSLRPER